MTEQIHYRAPKALRLHLEQLEKRIRQDAQRDEALRRREAEERQREHAEGVAALEAAVVTSAIKAQQR